MRSRARLNAVGIARGLVLFPRRMKFAWFWWAADQPVGGSACQFEFDFCL